MNEGSDDTIAAVATPVGEGAIAVVRVSGPGALGAVGSIFRGSVRLEDVPGHTVHYGTLVDGSGRQVDEVLVTVFRAPRSYTGEDLVEVSCHGGMVVTSLVLEAVLGGGARRAEPGEFTRRAFLNGKMDLSQAEAVAELIRAGSRRALDASLAQLSGRLGGKVALLRDELISLCALLEIDLDFAEEGLEVASKGGARQRIEAVRARIQGMIRSFEAGRVAREGVSVVLAGKPNAGKSSLFNALLEEDRAIVTHVPGTTRDTLEESINLDGMLFRISDTAGLRESEDLVERAGVSRSRSLIEKAEIVIKVVDVSVAQEREEALLEDAGSPREIIAWNKSDLLTHDERASSLEKLKATQAKGVFTSARTGEGLEKLRELLVKTVSSESIEIEGLEVTNRRHMESLKAAAIGLDTALASLDEGRSNEFIAFDIREAVSHLEEITGEVTSEEVLNSIFSKFCIGK